jgi:hypothetical protein
MSSPTWVQLDLTHPQVRQVDILKVRDGLDRALPGMYTSLGGTLGNAGWTDGRLATYSSSLAWSLMGQLPLLVNLGHDCCTFLGALLKVLCRIHVEEGFERRSVWLVYGS